MQDAPFPHSAERMHVHDLTRTFCRPRVIVPLHLSRDNPAVRYHAAVRSESVDLAFRLRQEVLMHAAMVAGDTAGTDKHPDSQWTKGWLPFAQHNSSARPIPYELRKPWQHLANSVGRPFPRRRGILQPETPERTGG